MAQIQKPLLLLLDKKNLLASPLAEKLKATYTVVLVSQKKIEEGKEIIIVPYKLPIPQIPDGSYVSFVMVYSPAEFHLLEPILKKAEAMHIPFFLISEEEIVSIPEGTNVLHLGDIFGLQDDFPLTTFLKTVKKTKHIRLSNMGLNEWYPVLFQDALQKIVDIVTSGEQKSYFIGPKHPYTELSLSHGLQKIDPDLAIDFVGEKEEPIHKQHEVSVFSTYNSIAKIQDVYTKIVSFPRKGGRKTEEQVILGKKKGKSSTFPWIWYSCYVLLVLIFLPLIVSLISGGVGAFLLFSGLSDVKNGSFTSAQTILDASQQNFTLAQTSAQIVMQEANLIGQGRPFSLVQNEIDTAQKITAATSYSASFLGSISRILSGRTTNVSADTQTAVTSLQEEQVALQTIPIEDIPSKYHSFFMNMQTLISMSSGLAASLPEVLGIGSQKTYLILFQNNMELRPGGGFIGSYGLLQLNNGRVQNFSIHNVYDADGQLKGHVEPPFAIRRYIPIVNLFLRDSNFDPDFTKDGQTAAILLSEETGVKVDGVIGIDLDTLKAILASVGSVYIPSYNQTVTDKNFFLLLENYAEKNSFPGSTQKQDFLEAVASSLLKKLSQKGSFSVTSLLAQTVSLLEGKHILVSFSDQLLQSPFTLAGLSDSLLDTRASASGTFNDYAGVVEANLGVNKVNAFVTRQVMQQIRIDQQGNAYESFNLTLTNNSDGSWPGGSYKNYVRFLLPADAHLDGISLSNVSQTIVPAVTDPLTYEAKSFISPKGLEVDTESEEGKTVYGFLVTVPIKTALSVQVSYDMPRAFSLSNQKQVYDLLIWKQAGIENIPYQLNVTLPNGFRFLGGDAAYTTIGQTAVVTEQIAKDTELQLSFGAK